MRGRAIGLLAQFTLAVGYGTVAAGQDQPMTGDDRTRSGASGVVIVAMPSALPEALRFADKLADGGVFVLVRQADHDASASDIVQITRYALDSLRHRADVRPDQIGLFSVGAGASSTALLDTFVGDTSLAFVVAVRQSTDDGDAATYTMARIPTLIIRPQTLVVDTLSSIVTRSTVGGAPERSANGESDAVVLVRTVGDHVTVWPVSQETIARLRTPLQPVVDRVVQWVQRQVQVAAPRGTPVLQGVIVRGSGPSTAR